MGWICPGKAMQQICFLKTGGVEHLTKWKHYIFKVGLHDTDSYAYIHINSLAYFIVQLSLKNFLDICKCKFFVMKHVWRF